MGLIRCPNGQLLGFNALLEEQKPSLDEKKWTQNPEELSEKNILNSEIRDMAKGTSSFKDPSLGRFFLPTPSVFLLILVTQDITAT